MAKPRRPKKRSSFAPRAGGKGGKPSMANLQQQMAQLQEEMARTQESLGEIEVTASSGGGMVSVTANGHQEVLSIKIDPQVVDPDDVEFLEDMVLAAVNEALQKAKAEADDKMGAVTGGLDLPGIL